MDMHQLSIFTLLITSFNLPLKTTAKCQSETLAIYELNFETFWDRKFFPKHYPQWRPPASWSKLIGFSHDSTFALYHEGQVASSGLKDFAERLDCSQFDLYSQGSDGVHDVFHVPPISNGVGTGQSLVSLDSNHTKISLVSKIIPSPDWFVGVDSYDLCLNGQWIDYINLEVGPLDAGTDQGLTFTSPNWPSDPREKIHKITAHYPDHPAGSFYYPQVDQLPYVAQFTLKKQKEYKLSTDFDAADAADADLFENKRTDIFRYKVDLPVSPAKNPKLSSPRDMSKDRFKNEVNIVQSIPVNQITREPGFKDLRDVISTIPEEEELSSFNTDSLSRAIPTPRGSESQTQTEESSLELKSAKKLKKSGSGRHGRKNRKRKRIPGGDAMSVIDDIVKGYQKEHRRRLKKKKREERKKRRDQMKKIRPPRDCRVSEWGDWSHCSKSCGIGERSRTRVMEKHAKRGGKPCPPLRETTWCGSAGTCPREYFQWKK